MFCFFHTGRVVGRWRRPDRAYGSPSPGPGVPPPERAGPERHGPLRRQVGRGVDFELAGDQSQLGRVCGHAGAQAGIRHLGGQIGSVHQVVQVILKKRLV